MRWAAYMPGRLCTGPACVLSRVLSRLCTEPLYVRAAHVELLMC